MSKPKFYFGTIHRHTPRRCPKCGKLLDSATPVGSDPDDVAGPAMGDVTVCSGCAALLVFDERLTLRSPTAAELQQLKANLEDWALVQALQRGFNKQPWK